jgi:3-oxoacyl-[acyl-carrier protein] reductase
MTEIINLEGKNALVTGGTRGIGKGIALRLARAGAGVALFYRADEAAAEATRNEISNGTGRRAEVYQTDVADEAQVVAGVERALADFNGGFDIVVHNAGGGDGGGAMPAVRTQQWRGVLGVNLDAAFFLTRALLERDGALSNGASIVFIASGAGHDPIGGLAAYGAAKAGLIHFAQALAQDVGPSRGVRVNVVSPGFTDTGRASEERKQAVAEQTALRRVGTPGDVAGAVLFFAAPELSGFVTGQWLRVNGGLV